MFFKGRETLKPYQVEGAKFALSNFYTLNRDKPGMGKSVQALLAVCSYLAKNPNGRALVVCPSYLRLNWVAETQKWTGLSPCLYTHRPKSVTWDSDLVIISYDQLKMFSLSWKFTERTKIPLKPCRLTKVRRVGDLPWRSPSWASACDETFQFVVVDEAHNFKTPTAKRTLNLVNFVTHLRPKYLLLLSGTPIKKKVQDLFVLLYLMALGERTGNKITKKYRTFYLFCHRFTNVVKTPFATLYKGVKNLDELKTYLIDRVIGRDPEKVLDLPEFQDVYVTVDYKENPALWEEYDNFNSGMEGKGAESSLKAESARLKAPFTVDYSEDLLEQDVGPLVIFTDHREAAATIHEGLKKNGRKGHIIQGGVAHDLRAEYVEKFQKGDLDYLVCTYGAASEGITLTRSCHLILNDFHWVPETISQARGRIRRIGQINRCIYHIIGGAVVDKKIYQSLTAAINIIEKVWRLT
jgi:SNF2 family DNA or RNA helicase